MNDKAYYSLGIDIGSTTVKIAILMIMKLCLLTMSVTMQIFRKL